MVKLFSRPTRANPTAAAHVRSAWLLAILVVLPSVVFLSAHEAQAGTVDVMSTHLPTALIETSAIWDGQNAYIFGGDVPYQCCNRLITTNQIVRYNPSTDTVSTMGVTLPSPRDQTSAIWDGQNAYIFGGWNGAALRDIVRYNPGTGSVSTVALMPEARQGTSAVWDGQNAYIFAGYNNANGGISYSGIIRYNPSTNTVTSMSATLPSGGEGSSAVWDGHHIIILNSDGSIARYDPATDSVTTMNAGIPFANNYGSAVWDGKLVDLLGGNPALSLIARYDPTNDVSITSGASLDPGFWVASAVWDGQEAFLFGGNGPNFQRMDTIVRFQPPTVEMPQSVSATSGPGPRQITLSWLPMDANTYTGTLLGYNVYRGDASGTETLLTTGGCSGVTITTCTDSQLPNSATEYYRVSALTTAAEGYLSPEVSATTFSPPSMPRNLNAFAPRQSGGIQMGWQPPTSNPSVDGGFPVVYNLYRGTASGAETFLARINGTSYYDPLCGVGGQFYYYATAVSVVGEGPISWEGNAVAQSQNPGNATQPCMSDPDTPAYQAESPTGNTPMGGLVLKPTFPNSASGPSVDLANGELIATFSLLQTSEPVSRDFSFDLTYRSMGNAEGNPALSSRWDANWLQRLEPNGTALLQHTGDGRTLTFANTSTGWDGPGGSYERITNNTGKLELHERDGARRDYDPAHGFNLTDEYDAAGNHWNLSYSSTDGKLESITDPLGRVATFAYDPSVSSLNNMYYASHGQPILTSVTDFAGRTVSLQYDLTTGKLLALRTPGATPSAPYTTRFGYDFDGRISSIQDPTGTTYAKFTYSIYGRTLTEQDSLGATYRFRYNTTAGITQAWDSLGNDVEWHFLEAGAATPRVVPVAKIEFTQGLRATDPANYTTAWTHNAQEETTRVTYPAGNVITYTYDEASPSFYSRGNLLTQTRSPGAVPAPSLQSTSQASITTRYTYDPTCNKPTTIVDPRGVDTSFAPPNSGTTSAARYTTTITYNSACEPISIQKPTVNPAGVSNPAFTSAYANQAITDTYAYNGAGQEITHTDPAGIVETRTYYTAPSTPGKPAGYLQSATLDPGPSPHLALTTTYEYTDYGVINKTIDPNGNVRIFTIDPRGRTTLETSPPLNLPAPASPASIHTISTYDANDNLVSTQRETNPGSGVYTLHEYTYDALNRLTSETTHPSSTQAITTHYAYDSNGNRIQRIGGTGETQSWSYDERNLLLSMTGPAGGTYAYDANENLKTSTDPLGHATSYQYDGYDRQAVQTNAQQSQFVTSYDPAGNVVMEKGLGGTSGQVLYERTYAYDEANRAYQHQEWLQSAATMPPASASTLGTVGRWVTTLHEYSPRGEVNRTINDNGHAAATTYDAAGRITIATDAVGNVAQKSYDPSGNLIQTKQTIAGATASTCPQVCTTQYAYDAENRLTTTTNPDGTARTNAYDGRGNLVNATDEAGNSVIRVYDDADRLVATQRSRGVTTTTNWDDEDRVQSNCDGLNKCTTYTYVPATQLVATEVPPTGPSIANTYDAAGNVIGVAYSSSKTITLGYDSLNRLTTVDLAGAPSSTGTTHQQFTYDDMGRITQATDNGIANLGSGVATSLGQVPATQQFDTLGRVIGESQLGLPINQTLDGVGNILSTTYPSADARMVSRTYDADERLNRVWDTKGLIAQYAYQGNLVNEKDFGGSLPIPPATGSITPVTKTLVAYNGAQRPTSIQHQTSAGTVLAGLTTRYDAVGNRAAQKLQGNVIGVSTDKWSQLYALDALYRTTSWKVGPITDSSPSSPLDTIATPTQQASWSSTDAQDNWQTWNPGSGACTRTTGTSSSVRTVSDACAAPAASKTFTFDANGNLATDGAYTYHWDFLNRLIRVDDSAGHLVAGYGYDAFNRRVVKVFPDNVVTGTGTQANREGWYTFAGQQVLQESQPVGSIQPTTLPPTAPNIHVIRQWTYGPNTDEILDMDMDANQNGISAIDPTDSRYFYDYDSAGNVLGLMSQTGHLVEGYAYQPYGNVTILVPSTGSTDIKWDGTDTVSTGTYGSSSTPRPYSPSGNLWFFTGRQYDPEVGLYNYRARHYHPGLGQFMSMDPIGTWGDPTNLGNPYAYVGNNPGSWKDPSGLYGWNDLFHDAHSFGTAVTAFVPCGCTDWARNEVKENYARFETRTDVPAAARIGAEILGPPQTKTEATIALGLAVIPGLGVEGKAAAGEVRLASAVERTAAEADQFAGVRELSNTLRSMGFNREARLNYIGSFEKDSITARTAIGNERFLRFWGEGSQERGRFLTRGLAEGQRPEQVLALPPGNAANRVTEFGFEPGTRYFEGRVAATKLAPGGGNQIFIPSLDALRPLVR